MKFLDIFNPISKGSHGLTDEAIYFALKDGNDFIPLYGGNQQHITTERYVSISAKTKSGESMKVFSGEGIIISLDGSAGCMTYKRGEIFALNHHAGFITVKDNMKDKVNMEYFSYFMRSHYKSLSVSDGSKTLSLDQIYSDEFELPNKEFQDKILDKIKPLIKVYESLLLTQIKLKSLLNKNIVINYLNYQAKNVSVKNCISYESGYSELTEEFIYSALLLPGEKYKVKSSSTLEETLIGYIGKCKIDDKPIRINNRYETLLIARNGTYVGQTEYLVNEKYTINDHAYILYVKDDCKYKINLKWFSIQYKSEIMNYTSNSANGTWNMTGFFKNVFIDIPSYEEQLKVVVLYQRAEKIKEKVNNVVDKINMLMNREILSNDDTDRNWYDSNVYKGSGTVL